MKINEVIIVEGKYDKIRLSNIVDTLIIQTNGFQIFNDKSKRELIKKLASERGVIILTDSDYSGMMIRNHIKSFVNNDLIKNAYVPDIIGKEKRKKIPSKEGKLGVEGIDDNIILNALIKAGATKRISEDSIVLNDLFETGFTGQSNSSFKRKELQRELNLPENLSTKSLLQVLNSIMTRTEFYNEFG